MKLEYKPQFFDDLYDISAYISEWFDDGLVCSITQSIHDGCRVRIDHPNLGRVYPRDEYFRFLVVAKKNVVFYHVEGDTVTLHRIFDSRRDYIGAIGESYSKQ